MKIKDIHIQELAIVCNDLLFKTLVELGQNKNEDWLLVMSNSLANDLKQDFKNLEFQDVVHAFREGVRNTDNVRFVINVQSYYIWIKAHEQLIWNEASKEPERRDKRLKYRSRKGTGLNSISNNIKQLKK
tara:strand:- start:804 stop:1193 length:390 start_codon:yes stop_codon:yes gene_type:complete